MDLPVRKKLPHAIPQWVAENRWFFITINCESRGKNQLCHTDIAPIILNAAIKYHEKLSWHCRLMLLMPDHLHAMIAFPRRTRHENHHYPLEAIFGRKTRSQMAAGFFRSSIAR
jgi:hypothetical protein